MGLWQCRLPEDHVILQVTIRLEKVHQLGVTQRPESFITWVHWLLSTSWHSLWAALSPLGQSQSCQSFQTPSWGSLVRLPQRIVQVPSLPSSCFWLGAHCPDQWPGENTRQKFTDRGRNEWKNGVECYFRRLMTSSKGTKMETQELGWIAS